MRLSFFKSSGKPGVKGSWLAVNLTSPTLVAEINTALDSGYIPSHVDATAQSQAEAERMLSSIERTAIDMQLSVSEPVIAIRTPSKGGNPFWSVQARITCAAPKAVAAIFSARYSPAQS